MPNLDSLFTLMPYITSLEGLNMVRRYVRNWYSLVFVYLRLRHSIVADFRNGQKVKVSDENFHSFRETIFREFLKDNGFTYSIVDNHTLITTDTGIKIILLPDYSFVINEIFVMKSYGESRLDGRFVIDIGGSIADSPLYFASLGAKKVYAFEVNPLRIGLAKRNVSINGMSETIEIIERPATPLEVSALIKNNSISNIFMKVDCDGCEYELIENLPTAAFELIDDITLEYTTGVQNLSNKLKAMGYQVKHNKHLFFPDGILYATKKKHR